MNYAYKMKYATYLETLTPEQRNAELLNSVPKGTKRTAKKTQDDDVRFPTVHISYVFKLF